MKPSVWLYLCMIMCVTCIGSGYSHDQPIASSESWAVYSHIEDTADTHSSGDELPESVLAFRLSASEFQHHKQITPSYELITEFLPEDLSAKHFTYIRSIPDVQPWYVSNRFVLSKQRISGWKTTRSQQSYISATAQLS